MGTRADFYIEENKKIEWLGSIAWDGYCIGDVEFASTKGSYIDLLKDFLDNRNDSTYPEDGWPWPWNNSKLTDECYIFMEGKIWRKYRHDGEYKDNKTPCYFSPCDYNINYSDDDEMIEPKISRKILLPDMEKIKNVSFGKGSGLIIFSEEKE